MAVVGNGGQVETMGCQPLKVYRWWLSGKGRVVVGNHGEVATAKQ